MFGRGAPTGTDVATAAQRRLAALAAEFRPDEPSGFSPGRGLSSVDESAQEDGVREPTVADSSGARPGHDDAPALPEAGRHAGRKPATRVGAWELTPHHVAVVALIVAVAIVVAAWWALRSVPDARPIQVASQRMIPSQASTPSSASASLLSTPGNGALASTSPSPPTGMVVVDVAGKVRRPGIVELPSGSRVIDAIKAAGGVRAQVDTSGLNLARPLADGEQVVVGLDVPPVQFPATGAPGGASSPSSAGIAPVNVNTATLEQLDTLPGIGPVTAASILEWRAKHGAFRSVDDLLDVSGIGDATLSDIRAYVYV